MQERKYLTVEAIAQELEVSEDLVRKWIRNKELPAYQFGKEYRVRIADYERFVEQRRTVKDG